jgi:hypothetical protein
MSLLNLSLSNNHCFFRGGKREMTAFLEGGKESLQSAEAKLRE